MNSLERQHKVTLDRGDGFDNETRENRDCTVRALQNVTGVPYVDAHNWMKARGRVDTHGISMTAAMRRAAQNKSIVYGYRVLPLWERSPYTGHRTLANVMPQLRKGRYVVVITGHTFAVIDGTILDNGINGARKQVDSIWKFEPSSEVEAREMTP